MSGMEAAVKDVLAQISKNAKGGYATPYEAAMGFVHAVDWERERWLQALGVVHVGLWAVAWLTRGSATAHGALFLVNCLLVFVSEGLNAYGAAHWREFSTQNYFDPSGIFAGVVYAGPIILLLLAQLINLLRLTSTMLIKQKRIELGVDKRPADIASQDKKRQ